MPHTVPVPTTIVDHHQARIAKCLAGNKVIFLRTDYPLMKNPEQPVHSWQLAWTGNKGRPPWKKLV